MWNKIELLLGNRKTQYLQLLAYKTQSDLKMERSKTYAGMLWWIIEPTLFMALYYVVFGILLGKRTEDFVAFLFVGLITWRWFNSSVMQAANSIIGGKGLMMQTPITPTFFPAISILTNIVKFSFTFTVLLIFLWIFNYGLSSAYLFLPLILATQFLFIAGCAYLVAAIVPFFPDIRNFLTYFMRALMYLSGIFYDGHKIPEHLQTIFYLNPIASLIDAYRNILINGTTPNLNHLIWVLTISIFVILTAKSILSRYRYIYSRVVM